MDLILATTNRGKVQEVENFIKYPVRTLTDIRFEDEIIEDGLTFAENALIKVRAVRNWLGDTDGYDYILADDSGLIIDSLDGQPGIYSARWLGKDTPYDVKNKMVLEMLSDIPEVKRTARFVCVMACVDSAGQEMLAEGVLEGRIAFETSGENGFGYDQVFYVPNAGCTLANLSKEEKNRISHRGLALMNLKKQLESNNSRK